MGFQSLTGFSPRCNLSAIYGGIIDEGFQSLTGFSPRCNRRRLAQAVTEHGFNPLLGFLLVATLDERLSPLQRSRFNPLLGFLLVATPIDVARYRAGNDVSIPYWVFSSLQPRGIAEARGISRVSIPYWVFSSLQLTAPISPDKSRNRFQSLTGFSPRCNSSSRTRRTWRFVFQSLTGFSPRCNQSGSNRLAGLAKFQSLTGFSPRCNNPDPIKRFSISTVSIPYWVFSSLQPVDFQKDRVTRSCFNPLLGFLLVATPGSAQMPIGTGTFQSLTGFSPRCNITAAEAADRLGTVSIPYWVFSSLQRQ